MELDQRKRRVYLIHIYLDFPYSQNDVLKRAVYLDFGIPVKRLLLPNKIGQWTY